MKKLRILLMSTSTEKLGTWWRCFHLGRNLAMKGHDVSLVAARNESTPHVVRERMGQLDVLLLPYTVFHANLFTGTLSRGFTVLGQTMLNSILQIISDADVFHSFDVMWPQNALPTVISRFTRSLRIHGYRIFVDWDDLYGRGGMLSAYDAHMLVSPRVVAPMLQLLEERVPSYGDAVTVTNETMRQHALGVGYKPDDVFILPNGSDVASFQPVSIRAARAALKLPEGSFIYAYVGSSSEGPEVFEMLLKAHMKVTKSYPDSVLLLVGILRPVEAKLVRSLNARNVLWVGHQPFDKYKLHLAGSDVLLLPTSDSIYDRARCPLRLGDYLATGRPIVATALPEIRRVVDGCGLSAKTGDPNDLAEKILQLKKDEDLREKFGKMARYKAKNKYSWSIIADQLEKIYVRYVS